MTTASTSSSFLKAGLASLPYIGTAVSILDMFLGGGKTNQSGGPLEIAPMAINMTQKLTGEIKTDVPYNTITFRTPGSSYTNYPNSEYPYYNEVLGVFNLLKTPVFLKKRECITVERLSDYIANEYFRLSSPIQYVINPAAKVEVQEIKAALLVYAEQGGGDFYQYESHDEVTGMDIYRTDYFDAACLPSIDLLYQREDIRCFYTSGIKGIKFLVNLKRKDAGVNTQNILLVLTYPIAVNTVTTFLTPPSCPGGVLQPIDQNTVHSYCSSTAYTASGRFARNYNDAIIQLHEEEKEWESKGQNKNITSLKVFPNPSNRQVKIDFSVGKSGNTKIYLTNSIGQTVKVLFDGVLNPANYRMDFDLSTQPSGIYFVHLETLNGMQTGKIVISK